MADWFVVTMALSYPVAALKSVLVSEKFPTAPSFCPSALRIRVSTCCTHHPRPARVRCIAWHRTFNIKSHSLIPGLYRGHRRNTDTSRGSMLKARQVMLSSLSTAIAQHTDCFPLEGEVFEGGLQYLLLSSPSALVRCCHTV